MSGFEVPGRLPENLRDVRRDLDALKAEVGKNDAGETPDQRRVRIAGFLAPLVTKIDALRTEREAQATAIGTFAATPEHQKLVDIDTALITEDGAPAMTADELIDGLTEGAVTMADLENLTTDHIQDEEELLKSTMSAYDKVSKGVSGIYKLIPKNYQDQMLLAGIDEQTFVTTALEWLAGVLDRGPGKRISKIIRQENGLSRAWKESIPEAAITSGKTAWEAAYAAWQVRMDQNPDTTEVAPDLYLFIAQEKEKLDRAREFAALKARFDADPAAMALFGGVPIELQLNGPAKAVQAGGAWKVLLPVAGVQEAGTPPVFSLTPESESLKNVLDAVKTGPFTEVSLGMFELKKTGALTADISGDMTAARLKKSALIVPNGAFSTLKMTDDIAVLPAGIASTATYENQTLKINYAVLDEADLRLGLLRNKAAAAAATATWHFNAATGDWA